MLIYTHLDQTENYETLDSFIECWPQERRKLATFWQVTAAHNQDQYGQVCDLLLEVGAAPKLLEIAERAADDENWDSVVIYLDCVQGFNSPGQWVSPYIVAQLYYKLGIHYKQIADFNKALDSFHKAAAAYPVIWHAPYIEGAQLYEQNGQQIDAINWLSAAISNTDDPTALFYLWQELGLLWLGLKEEQKALCSIAEALNIVDEIPEQNITKQARIQLEEQYTDLVNDVNNNLDKCK